MTTTNHTPATSAPSTLVDLERELSCSICTDILYHPLTLLDCLHTFCGSCLKEWFSSQRRRTTHQEVVYTCPSCRAHVRDTRPNAQVTTLLDMYLAANPTKNKTEQEKAELDAIYKRGDVVLPIPEPSIITGIDTGGERVHQRILIDREDALNAWDDYDWIPPSHRRAEQARRSQRNAGERAAHAQETETSRPQTARARESSSEEMFRRLAQATGRLTIDQRSSLRQDIRRAEYATWSRRNAEESAVHAQETEISRPQTALERESSIRSLLGSSGFDSAEMEAEIMQQVVQGGLLDGIDLRNLSPQQEDEIIQRIAEAYRRQQRERRQRERARERSQTRHALAERPQREATAHPPLSRPHLLETASDGPAQPRPGSRGEDPSPPNRSGRDSRRSSGERIRPASRSATDLSLRPQSRSRQTEDASNQTRRLRPSSHSRERRATDPQSRSLVDAWRNGASFPTRDGTIRTSARAPPRHEASPTISSLSSTTANSNEATMRQPSPITAPSRSCARCGKQNIERRLHYSCHKCTDDVAKPYTLCQRCYRQGKGCLHWFGFAHAATARFESQNTSASQTEPPHVMRAEKYILDAEDNAVIQHGKFCDICSAHSDSCYWSCDICLDGSWGYCDTCVGQAKHCTHSLLATVLDGPVGSDPFKRKVMSLQVRLPCSICRRDIPLDEQHVHCPTCNDGDYDVCMPCLQAATARGTMANADGLGGWRRCPRDHRMLLVTFVSRTRKPSPAILLTARPRPERLVLENVGGGWALRDNDAAYTEDDLVPNQWSWRDTEAASGRQTKQRSEHTQLQRSRSTMQALWTRIPDEEATDELTFPRGAEITEVVDINGDWAWGIYCGAGGLFPANYGRVLEI